MNDRTVPPQSRVCVDAPIADMLFADCDLAQDRVVEAGWNQVPADWETFLALGGAFKVQAAGGSLAATAATLPYAGGFGWISMVLVAAAMQRQGIATRLLAHCIECLRSQGLVSVLDATPAGREVYRRLGFADGWAISRWYRGASSVASATGRVPGVRTALCSDVARIAELDAVAFGSVRPALLERLLLRSGHFACIADASAGPRGFLLGREGRVATQFGPLIVHDETTAAALLDHALLRAPGPIIIDAPDRHKTLAQALSARGFSVQRPYTRMTLDRPAPFGEESLTMAIAGPELG